MTTSPPKRDYTAAKRSRRADATAALVLPKVRLDDEHARAFRAAQRPGETTTATLRRLILDAAGSEFSDVTICDNSGLDS